MSQCFPISPPTRFHREALFCYDDMVSCVFSQAGEARASLFTTCRGCMHLHECWKGSGELTIAWVTGGRAGGLSGPGDLAVARTGGGRIHAGGSYRQAGTGDQSQHHPHQGEAQGSHPGRSQAAGLRGSHVMHTLEAARMGLPMPLT